MSMTNDWCVAGEILWGRDWSNASCIWPCGRLRRQNSFQKNFSNLLGIGTRSNCHYFDVGDKWLIYGWWDSLGEGLTKYILYFALRAPSASKFFPEEFFEPWGFGTVSNCHYFDVGDIKIMAVREGFEPSIRVNVYPLSRRAPSTTQTPHRVGGGL